MKTEKREMVKPRTLSGFMELLPQDQILFNQVKQVIESTYEEYGFLPLDTPIIESSEVLLAKAGGETEKQIYRFEKGNHDLSLRFDLTVPLAKYVAAHQGELAFPFRRYQIGKVYRGERAQAGRFREFYQCDIDVIGEGELSLIHDAELPSVIYQIFKKLDIGDFTIHINNRKLLNGLFESLDLIEQTTDIMRTIDKIDKIGEEAVKEELTSFGIEKEKIETILHFISLRDGIDTTIKTLKEMNIENETFIKGLDELQEVVKYIRAFGVPDQNFTLDLTIARGLDYYTGTVYETFLDDYRSLGSICSGGRYENLAEYYTKQKLPGVGISIGLTRLFYKLQELNLLKKNKPSISQVLVIPASAEELEKSIEVGSYLRQKQIPTEIYLGDKKLKAKLKYADKLMVPYIVIIGESEVQNQTVSLKNMKTGKQQEMSLEEAIEEIQK